MKPDTSKSTVLVICMGFLLISIALKLNWAAYTSLGIGVLAIASPFLSKKIEWAWMKLSHILGFIVPNIILSIVFFVFLFPLALISRLSKKDPLMLSGKYKTYFVDINKAMEKSSFEKIW